MGRKLLLPGRIVKMMTVTACMAFCSYANAQKEVPEIRIDPDQPLGAPAAKLFRSIQYIPLETTKESLLGRVDRLYVTDSMFVVLDYSTNNIFIFRKDGKFHTKFSAGHKSEYGGIRFLNVDAANTTISFRDYDGNQKTYDFNGNQLSTRKLDDGLSYYYPLKDSVEVRFRLNYDHKGSGNEATGHELNFFRGDSLLRQEFSYTYNNKIITNDEIIYGYDGVFFGTPTDSLVHLVKPYQYTVYAVTPDSSTEAFRFVFPQERSLPADFLTNAGYYRNRFKYLQTKGPKMITVIASFYQIRNWAFFRLLSMRTPGNQSFSFMYNLDNNALFAVENIAPDASNSYLPIGSSNGLPVTTFMAHSFLANDGTAIYSSVTSGEMFAGKEAAKAKNVTYNEVLTKYFKQSDRKSNPVIVQMIPR